MPSWVDSWKNARVRQAKRGRRLSLPQCGWRSAEDVDSLPPSAPFGVGDIVAGRYRIGRVLGLGTNAITYQGEDMHFHGEMRHVVIKALSLARMRTWKDLELFEREAKTLRSLKHPSIPEYVAFEMLDDHSVYVLVQRLARGVSLQCLIDDGAVLDATQIYALLRQLLDVLAYLGALFPPVVHRDIKPANVVVDLSPANVDGEIPLQMSLVDFGAVSSAGIGSAHTTLVGTLGYMAPEQLGGVADPRSDLYAAGATVLATITRIAPEQLPRERLVVDVARALSHRQISQLGAAVPVLQRMLLPNPEDRFESAAAALYALEGFELAHGGSDSAIVTPMYEINAPNSVRSTERFEPLLVGSARLDASQQNDLRTELRKMKVDLQGSERRRIGLISWLRGRRRIRRPAGTRVSVERDGSDKLLVVTIPPPGFSPETVYSGVFAAVWLGLVGVWTAGALSAGAGAIFTTLCSTPFWWAGAKLTRATLSDVRGTTRMLVCNGAGRSGVYYFRVMSDGPLGNRRMWEGDARDIICVEVEKQIVDGQLTGSNLVLVEGVRRYRISDTLQGVEEQWLCNEINDFLRIG